MSVIEITAAQARALAALAETHGALAIHQVESGGDVYITPHGSTAGFRVAQDRAVSDIGETLPAP
ncbi:MAG TPA: hypothetical protein VFM96_13010 [Gaiellaceae bacterium]|nr:hypothetical protein [Gaiellaceae bacterium]